jgi:hypothetical protein
MDPLRDYTEHWFRHTAITHHTRFLFRTACKHIAEIEFARPGFSHSLRAVALAHLSDEDKGNVRQALTALAIVGTVEDIDRIKAIAERDAAEISAVARFAQFELEHRAA